MSKSLKPQSEYTLCLAVSEDSVYLVLKCPSPALADIHAAKLSEQINEGFIELKLQLLETTTH